MTTFDTNRPNTMANGVRLSTIGNSLFATISAWNDRRATRNALGKLTDRELDDIGLNRGDILAITK